MNNPNTIKSIIYETIQKYINDKFTSNASMQFKAPEQIEEYSQEFRTGNNLINISKLCLDNQIIINHVTYMINKDSLELLEDFHEQIKKIIVKDDKYENDKHNDNELSNKLYPFILYLFTEIFRDNAKGGNNFKLWVHKNLKEKNS
jgi:hypothetical protein